MRTAGRVWCFRAVALSFSIGLLILGGCGESVQEPAVDPSSWETQRSDLERNLSPDVNASDMAELVRGNHRFAADIYHALENQGENLLLSPFSMRMAFAMAFAGARGQTEAEIAEVLHFTLGQAGLHEAYNALDLELGRRNHPGTEDEDPVELYIANAFWGQIGYPFLKDYLDLLALNYGSGVESLDFRSDSEACRRIINAWVAKKTRDRILDLLPPGSIDGATVAVLTNTLYLKAPWALPFEEDLTTDGRFDLIDGTQVTVPMMRRAERFAYAEGDGYRALEMNYRTEEVSMVFILPDPGRFAEFESALDADRLFEIVEGLKPAAVEVRVPRFSFKSPSIALKDALYALGMVVPFTGSADFSRMVEGGGIYIDDAYHKTFIQVDEKGTEAAAATAIVFRETSVPGDPEYEFTADRPFLFLIRDRVTGTILFIGRVLDPAAE